MKNEQLLEITTYAGEILLRSGAEIYRVEDTINYIFKAYGVHNASAYILTQGIFISYTDGYETFNKILRVNNTSLNIFKINAVNNLSRRIQKKQMEYEAVITELDKIDNALLYQDWVVILMAGASCFLFTLFFNGTLRQAVSSIPIGILGEAFYIFLKKYGIANMICTLLTAAFLSIGCMIIYSTGFITSYDSIMIGCLMLLVPGLPIENAIQDSMRGDYICGLTKALEAFMIAVMMALGSGSILVIWRALL